MIFGGCPEPDTQRHVDSLWRSFGRPLMPFAPVDCGDAAPGSTRETMTDRVYAHLREQLAIGNFTPGERLSLRELGSELGVSVMPVREAVNRLVADRALEVTPTRVLRVPLTTAQQVRDLADIRIAVEGFAAERAALVRTDADLAAIEAAALSLRRLTMQTRHEADDWIGLNRTFHFQIYEAARLPLLFKLIGDLWLRAGPVLNLDLRSGSQRLVAAYAEQCHERAVQAIRAGDGPAARQAIADDISAAADYIVKHSEWLAT